MQTMKYDYRFNVWPHETWGHPRELFDLFRLLNGRLELTFTETEFEMFRSKLSHIGYTLRGVVRVPHQEVEVVL
jgi:hypothetical protein